jgi:hypothetical protein
MSLSSINIPDKVKAAITEFRKIGREFYVLIPPEPIDSFKVDPSSGSAQLTWATNDYGEDGFEIERKEPGDKDFTRIKKGSRDEFEKKGNLYNFTDAGLEKGRYSYRIRSFNRRSESEFNAHTINVPT